MPEQKIGVVGGGLMGHGIAYLLAAVGHDVGVFEPVVASRASLPQRLHAIATLFGDDPALLRRISAHDQLAPAVKDAAFVFEAAPERLPVKQGIFADLESVVAPDAILASNSSAIPSSDIGRNLKHRQRVIGTHFGIRRIWFLWLRLSRTKKPAVRSCRRPWSCFAMPARRRCMCAATFPALSGTGCSTR